MFKLWCLAENDLLRESNTYRLVNTGQVSHKFGLTLCPAAVFPSRGISVMACI